METYGYLSVIDEKKAELDALSDYLWDNAETAFSEFRSAAYIADYLKRSGFEVSEKLADIPTAFSGRFGSGHPVIGVLGEFDALSGLSQAPCATEKTPLPGKDCGQGCGHNLLGMAGVAAALAIKEYLIASGKPGTVIFFGCPGEEGGSGKAFMARDGVFDGLDCAVTFHPAVSCSVKTYVSLANCQIVYRFKGIPSHAGTAPENGRSALDALELMNIGVQFLREHMPSDCRIHYAITDTGGFSPNVVQDSAEAIYLIRAPKNEGVKKLYERVNRIAEGAALMTETETSHEFIKACSNNVNNKTMIRVMQDVLNGMEPPLPTDGDISFARAMTGIKGDPEMPYHYKPIELREMKLTHGSTDVGDVSYVCPTVQINTATWMSGTVAHTWQATSQGKSPYAREMARYAGKIMAATAVRFLEDPALLAEAKTEHLKNVGPDGYRPPIPKGVKPKAVKNL